MPFRRIPLLVMAGMLIVPALQCGHAHAPSVTLSVIHHYRKLPSGEYPPPNGNGVPRQLTTDRGYQVTLEKAFLVVSRMELVECPTAALGVSLFRSAAYAHEEPVTSVLDVPQVESLLTPDGEIRAVGALTPRAAWYCRMKVRIGPATASAIGLPNDVDLAGTSIYLEGRFVPPGGGEATAFVARSSASAEREIVLEDDEHRPEPAQLAEGSHYTFVLGKAYDGWLDGIDLATADAEARGAAVLASAAASLHQHPAPEEAHAH